ncbi:uncharacterized protein si:busm1-163l24.3 [Thalassophryne amazonica]|uniref:uncharacterized protein si:busm1-163l24.3 n=1 Tax=Thalassophryne amazonica TaxID=390379 RepID=UPI0014723BBA|nr:uncharacterized protein si:busm1-163l24.3 [Thalassophryne amazonica]XP_034046969.1 uncharacterized protein si:busm1-163l24.3 [Thalassophryne amazonica]XP_034046970.1 uncharacterized protein si:busm1-163l24.3 [Thalassophryne amazonica]XP_034046971.1 uncharacterized protein si:busm1-163l24.3 [Thalassophryne amazonica]
MQAPIRTVRVNGLPTDIDDDRLKDKLFIHFLRTRNGGGEINSIHIVKEKPGSALITFEDSGVAQRVIQHSQHNLELDGKTHELILTEHRESLDLDKVVLSLSATVDYSQIPLGILALKSLKDHHRDVQISFDATDKLCTLKGSYSKIQAALALLVEHPGSPQSAENKYLDQPAAQTSWTVHKRQKLHAQDSVDQKRKSDERAKQKEQVHIDRLSEVRSSHPHTHFMSAEYDWEDTGQAAGKARQLSGLLATSEEDFSLILDADMFHYLLKHCREDYQHILHQHGVEVVDVTVQGVTTLFLHATTASRATGQEQEHLRLARNEISRLYQENESNIRRGQLPKSILPSREGLQMAFEKLNLEFPKLLLTEDDQNVNMVGSYYDVSAAKQFLLDHGGVTGKVEKEEDVGSTSRYSFDSGSQRPPAGGKIPLPKSSTAQSLDCGIENIVKSHENDTTAEGARKYKLAARFKDSGFAGLRDFNIQGHSSSGRQERLGPVLGHRMLSETVGVSGGTISRATAQNTGGDILFKNGDTVRSSMSGRDKTFLNSDVITQTKSKTTSTGSDQSTLLISTVSLPAQSGSPLKRSSSFSGTLPQKSQGVDQKIEDDLFTSTSKARSRSSSFSSQTRRDKGEVHMTEIVASFVLWNYIKEAYNVLLEDLSTDVRLKEIHTEGSQDATIVLIGANMQKVSSCQQSLQKLLDRVTADFCFEKLSFSDLGVTNPENETLLMCCDDIRSRHKKVTVFTTAENLCVCGPRQLCSEVIAVLREIFSGESTQVSQQQSNFDHLTFTWDKPTDAQVIKDQDNNLHCNSNPQQILKTKSFENGVGSVAAGSNPDASLCQKEMITHSVVTQNDDTEHDQDMIKDLSGESTSGQGDMGCICVCGESGVLTTRTKCGVAMCSQCLDKLHVHCRVCIETEPIPPGIQGETSYSKLSTTIPGHYKDSTIKVTYCIPDGIQADNHPYPGQPFQGGVFVAYLPDCKEARKLLPRLKKAFTQGLTFTLKCRESQAWVTWDKIPHKTSIHGGKSGKGYPDSTYLTRLSAVLASYGISEAPVKDKR